MDIEDVTDMQASTVAKTGYFRYRRESPGLQSAPNIEYAQFRTHQPRQGLVVLRPAGPPEEFLRTLLNHWRLTPAEGAALLGHGAAGARVSRVLSGISKIESRDEKDRIVELFAIRSALTSLFRDRAAENDWLRERQDELGARSPIELLLEGSMANLLRVRQFVDCLAGL